MSAAEIGDLLSRADLATLGLVRHQPSRAIPDWPPRLRGELFVEGRRNDITP